MAHTKVAVVGGGWLGCHISNKLKDTCTVTLYEKQDLFGGSSFYNQNRLHAGFHYSRNWNTRKLCQTTFNKFIQDYGEVVSTVDRNLYIVPNHRSLLDFQTYKGIFEFEQYSFSEASTDAFTDIEGGICVDERYIDPVKAKQYFQHKLADITIYKEVGEQELELLAKTNDIVVNTTNNILLPLPGHYYELSLTLLYTRKNIRNFGAITMVDGPLFSIYPYSGDDYTVTDVEYTPLGTFETIQELQTYKEHLTCENVQEVVGKVQSKILHYYKDFCKDFEYKGYYTSIKVKNSSQSADRSPTIVKDGNIISCVTGKIQGVYNLENYIQNEIINR